MKFFDGYDVEHTLSMQRCIQLMEDAFTELSDGGAIQVLRTAVRLDGGNIMGVMPAASPSKQVAGTKIISIFQGNFNKGLPSHMGIVVVIETETGFVKGIVDGESVTGIRTAAVSAVATKLLARKDAKTIAFLGSGLQARKHLEAIRLVRPIESVTVWDINAESAERFAKAMTEQYGIPVTICSTSTEAVKDADIICAVTSAKQPVLFGADLKPGVHINAVGACTARDRELDTECLVKGRLFGDSVDSVNNEAGDYLIPLNEGAITADKFESTIGDVLTGRAQGRRSDSEITIFEALGLAIEDLFAADFVIDYCEKQKEVTE